MNLCTGNLQLTPQIIDLFDKRYIFLKMEYLLYHLHSVTLNVKCLCAVYVFIVFKVKVVAFDILPALQGRTVYSSGYSVASKHPMQGWHTLSCPLHIHWYHFYTMVRRGCDLLRHCPMSLPYRNRTLASCMEARNDDHSATAAHENLIGEATYLHNSDIICSVNFCILGQLLAQGSNGTFQMFSLSCILLLNIRIYTCRFSL